MDTQKFNHLLKKIKYDKKAVELIYRDYYAKIKAHIQRRFGKLLDAEDAAQDMFEKLMTIEVDSYVDYPVTWLYRVADHHIIDSLRIKHPEEVALLETQPADFDIDDTILRGDVKAAILKLDKVSQKIIYLYYWENYKFAEIATMLNISYANTRAKTSRAYKELKKFLKGL